MKYEDLLKELVNVEPKDLIEIYLQAKTGQYITPDLWPATLLGALESLKAFIDDYDTRNLSVGFDKSEL